jgi:hypothetical protein
MNQSVIETANTSNIKQRNDLVKQNSTSRDKSAPSKAPITDIRKKQSSTLNVDDMPPSQANSRGLKNFPLNDALNQSLERETNETRFNQGVLGSVKQRGGNTTKLIQ